MPDGLAFSLYAPLAAMGDLAVGERRGGFDRPGRSAVLGLVAAALGYDRHDDDAHAALDRAYSLALRVRLGGTLMIDYHTVQAPPADRKARWSTRREALDRPSHRLETLLSARDYRSDLWVDVALVRLAPEKGGPPPAALAEALRRPAYTLYVGRKSCPLGRPPAPKVSGDVTGIGDLLALLDGAAGPGGDEPRTFAPLGLKRIWDDKSKVWNAPLYADTALERLLAPDFEAQRVERRRDRVASRARWQFALRDEIVAKPVPRPAANPVTSEAAP